MINHTLRPEGVSTACGILRTEGAEGCGIAARAAVHA